MASAPPITVLSAREINALPLDQRSAARAQNREARRAQSQQRITDMRAGMDQRRADRLAAREARQANAGGGTNAAQTAYDTWKESTGYQARLQEGYDAVNANWAARGAMESGAAQKSLLEYGQTFASNDIYPYMGMLGNVMTQGTGAASALAGSAGNYANSMSSLNNAYAANMANAANNLGAGVTAGNTNLANAQSNYATNVGNIYSQGAIAGANNTNAMLGGIGNSIGGALGYYAYN